MKSKRTIEEVMNYETGNYISADEFFNKPIDELTIYRSELQKAIAGIREPLFVCIYCKQKVRIRGGKSFSNRRKADILHFAHLKDSEECPIKTDNNLSKFEVNRIKYNGEKESKLHKDLKHKIGISLKLNRSIDNRFCNIKIEKIIKSQKLNRWRKPDISTKFGNKQIAIELQLSTTWLDVITNRQHFYKEQGIFLLWVFNRFDTNDDSRRLAFDDVVFTNNSNAFIFDDELFEKSQNSNKLLLRCYYKIYFIVDNEIVEHWNNEIIQISDLTFEHNNYSIYFHNSKQNKKSCEIILAKRKEQLEKRKIKVSLIKSEFEKKISALKTKKNNLLLIHQNYTYQNESINYSTYIHNSNIIILKNILKNNKQITEEICDLISKDRPRFYSSSFDEDIINKIKDLDLYNTICNKHLENLQQINKNLFNLKRENDDLCLWRKNIHRFETIHISNITYSIISPKNYWSFLENNFNEILILNSDDANSLFLSDYLIKINSLMELKNYKFSHKYIFLFNFSEKLDKLKRKISNSNNKLEYEIEKLKNLKKIIAESIESIVLKRIELIDLELNQNKLDQQQHNIKLASIAKKIQEVENKICKYLANHKKELIC
ncbi:MAG: hypothetical protein KAS49_00530 [Candidatus Cloacimonetes bacterium]|nr:hypothetical protein [Candidatus Cloacimonadota bacterium]